MRRLPAAVASVAAVVVVTLCVPALPAAADGTLTATELTTQANVETLLSNLQNVVTSLNANPLTAAGLANASLDPLSAIASAQQVVSQLTSDQLDQLAGALAEDPSWQSMPTQLSDAVQAFSPSTQPGVTPKDFAGTFTDSCDSAGSAPDEFTATEVANEVQSAAQAAMLAAPGVFAAFIGVDVPTGVKIALAVIWGVTNAIYLALAQTLAVATDCAQTQFTNTQLSLLPVDPSNPSTNVPASSEISVQNLINQATGTQTEITNVLNTVDAVNTQADTLITNAGTLNDTLNDINTRVAEVQTDLQTLQTNVSVLENTEVHVLEKADTEIANLNTFQTLQVRMLIEENLARNGTGTGPVGLFQLPAAFGGYLDTVKSIVTSTFADETASGRPPSAKALSDLAAANALFAAGHYKLAYGSYTKAYQDVR
jgi:hypothetical protein